MPALPQKRSSADRRDPPQRKLEGYHSTALRNADPKMHYVFAHQKDEDTGRQLYEHLGYEVVIATEGGVQMAVKKTPLGQAIEYRGHVLMHCDRQEIQDRWQFMQDEADKQQNRIVTRRDGIDSMRGINKQVLDRGYLKVVNETTELVTE